VGFENWLSSDALLQKRVDMLVLFTFSPADGFHFAPFEYKILYLLEKVTLEHEYERVRQGLEKLNYVLPS